MPRPRQYQNNAERQAAYRQRHRLQQPPREDRLAALARSLHFVLQDAVEANENILPAFLLGARADATLGNLVRYIHWHTTAGKSDPLWTPFEEIACPARSEDTDEASASG